MDMSRFSEFSLTAPSASFCMRHVANATVYRDGQKMSYNDVTSYHIRRGDLFFSEVSLSLMSWISEAPLLHSVYTLDVRLPFAPPRHIGYLVTVVNRRFTVFEKNLLAGLVMTTTAATEKGGIALS
jgi:hypothetical protein